MMSLRSPGVMMSEPGRMARSAFGTLAAHNPTSVTRRVRSSPANTTRAFRACATSSTRGAARSTLHGTTASGRSFTDSSAFR